MSRGWGEMWATFVFRLYVEKGSDRPVTNKVEILKLALEWGSGGCGGHAFVCFKAAVWVLFKTVTM